MGFLDLVYGKKISQSQIVGVSNSSTQKEYILKEAKNRKLNNIRIVTADMNDFTIEETFDRVVSVEMFEHMRNYRKLLERIAGFLKKMESFSSISLPIVNLPTFIRKKMSQTGSPSIFLPGASCRPMIFYCIFRIILRLRSNGRLMGPIIKRHPKNG